MNTTATGAPTMLTTAKIKARGWTQTDIDRLLCAPDALKRNPRYASGAPMKLYLESRVVAAESTPAFLDRKAERGKRKTAAALAVNTKRKTTAAAAAALVEKLRIEPLPDYPTLRRHALNAKRAHQHDRGDYEGDPDSAPAPVIERWICNYARHQRSNYHAVLEEIRGLVGTGDAYRKVRRAIDREVDRAIEATRAAARA